MLISIVLHHTYHSQQNWFKNNGGKKRKESGEDEASNKRTRSKEALADATNVAGGPENDTSVGSSPAGGITGTPLSIPQEAANVQPLAPEAPEQGLLIAPLNIH